MVVRAIWSRYNSDLTAKEHPGTAMKLIGTATHIAGTAKSQYEMSLRTSILVSYRTYKLACSN